MWTGIARIILKNRIPILIILFLLTVFMGYNARHIQMSYQYAPLLPKDDPAYQEYESFINNFGNEGNLLVIGVKDKNFFSVSHFNNWNHFSDELKNIHGVKSVFSATQAYSLIKNKREKKFEIHHIFPDKIRDQYSLDSLKNEFFKFLMNFL